MDLAFSKEDETFRQEVRQFIEECYTPEMRRLHARSKHGYITKEAHVQWQKSLAKKGWLAPNWPQEYGGPGFTQSQKYIFNVEMGGAGVPHTIPFGPTMVAPVIMKFGSAEQKKRFLPDILETNVLWCQGYSEPGAGSDLASLKTKAEDMGDHFLVNGSKIWTSVAQWADWIFCLVRTSNEGKPQEGISFLLIDMKTPGIKVDPIICLDSTSAPNQEVNQVFFQDVKVPKENLIGEENKGWTYAKFLLGNERSGIAGVSRSKKAIERLKSIASAELVDGVALIRTDEFSRKVAELEIDLTALEVTELRTLAAESKGRGPGPEASILKIKGTEIQQRITELTLEAVGNYGFVNLPAGELSGNEFIAGPDYSNGAAQTYFNMRKTSIYGGSNEIQHNIIAKMVLGL